MQINIKHLTKKAKTPTKAYIGDAGFDLYCSIEDTFGKSVVLWPEDGAIVIPTDIAMEIPEGYFGMICDRSSLGSRGLKVMGGVIDAKYLGNVKVCLTNVGNEAVEIKHGDRVAQLVVLPVPNIHLIEVDHLGDSQRGEKGFGSSDAR